MKKIISWILLAAMMLSLLAGCGQAADPTQPSEIPEIPAESVSGENNAADVIAYLDAIYRDHGSNTPGNFQRFGIVRIAGVPYEVVWTADIGEDLLKVVVNDDGTVTIDVNEECTQDTPYILTATCTDSNGNTESTSWDYVLPGVDFEGMKDIVDQAYALDKGAAMDGVYTLMGEIISVDSAWSDQYKNITVSIIVKDREDKPIQCYRLKGDGAQDLMIGDTITVYGNLKNYNGTIEFDAGCQLVAVIKGDGVVIEAPSDPLEIMKAAYDLKTGMSLPYEVTLTGAVTGIDTAYSTQYKNISVVMDVDGAPGYEILCYRLKGEEADTLNVNDIITVTGKIKNYAGTIEFDYPTLESVTQKPGPKMPNNEQCIVDSAYALGKGKSLPYTAILTGKVVSIDTPFSDQHRNISITIAVDQRENKPIICYRLSGTGAETLEVGDVVTVVGTIKHYYNTTTKESKIEFDQGCKIMDVWKSFSYGPLNEGPEYLMFVNKTDSKLYFNGTVNGSGYLNTTDSKDNCVSVKLDKTNQGILFYFVEAGKEIYINAVPSGSYAKFELSDTANSYFTYNTDINAYTIKVNGKEFFMGSSGTYNTLGLYTIDKISNSNYQPVVFATDDPKADTTLTVAEAIAVGKNKAHNNYTDGKYFVTGKITEIYNTQYGNMKITDDAGNILTIYGTWSADGNTRFDALTEKPAVGDTVTFYGVIGQYNGTPQMKNGWLRAEGDIPTAPDTPDVPEVTVNYGPLAENTAYSFKLDQANLGKTLYFNGSMSGEYFATTENAAEAVAVYMEKVETGVRFYFMNNGAKTYLEIYKNSAGKIRPILVTAPTTVFNYNTEAKVYTVLIENTNYYLGTFNTYNTFSASSTYYITGSNASTVGVSQFVGQFVVPGGSTPDVPVEPDVPVDPNPDEPEVKVSTIAEALAAATDAEVSVKGVVTLLDSSNVYVQDSTGAICVRMSAKPTDLAVGDTIEATGKRADYNGLPQLGSATYTKSSGMTLSVKETTISALTNADICTYVKLSGLTVTEVYDNNGAYSSPNITVQDDAGNSIQLYKAVVGKTDGAWNVKVGDVVTISGALSVFKTTYQLRNSYASEVIVTSQGGETEDPEVPVEPDVPTLTASTLSFASKSNRVSQNEDQQVWAQNGITFTNNMAASINPVADYANPVRLYAGSDIIIAASGMKKIEIHVNANKGTSGLTGALNAAGISYTESGNVITIEFASAVNSLTITGLTAQVRFDSITVYA